MDDPRLDLGPLTFGLTATDLGALASAIPARALEELTELLGRTGPCTVDGFLGPLDRLLLSVVNLGSHCRLLLAVHTDPTVRDAAQRALEASDRFMNAFRTNREVYDAVRAVDLAQADAPTTSAVTKLLREMRRAGVELEGPDREVVRRLNDEIDATGNEFEKNIAEGTRTFVLEGPDPLDGLPDDFRASHPTDASGRVTLTTAYTDVHPVMASARRPDVRQRTLAEFLERAYPKNREVLGRLLAKRHELANRLGFPSYAAFAMDDKMAKSPATVHAFLDRVLRTLKESAITEVARIAALKAKEDGENPQLQPWDYGVWTREGFYDSLDKARRFGVDAQTVREYFRYPDVRDGLFALCGRLFGLRFRRVDVPGLWHPTVEAYDAFDGDRHLGRFYLDLVPRDGKYGHAAQFDVRLGVEGVQLPQAALICNFVDPAPGPERALLRYSGVVTFFHEFGHLLHALYSGHGAWVYNEQPFVEWDFIEAPSQIFEEWALDPETLRLFARHHATGDPIPAELAERMTAAERLGRAYKSLTQVRYATASLAFYERDPASFDPFVAFPEIYDGFGIVRCPEGSHFPAAWGHLNGYSAVYYSYLWALVIARDLLAPFREKGTLLAREIGERYAKSILVPGGARPAAAMVEEYLGRPFSYDAFESWIREASRSS